MLPVLELCALSPSLATDTASLRPRISLNGVWERHVNGAQYDLVNVPSSLRPLGYYHLKRQIVLPRLTGQRAFVHFDSVHYHGRVFVNGNELGTTRPYVPYAFELTGVAREGQTRLMSRLPTARPSQEVPAGTKLTSVCTEDGRRAAGSYATPM